MHGGILKNVVLFLSTISCHYIVTIYWTHSTIWKWYTAEFVTLTRHILDTFSIILDTYWANSGTATIIVAMSVL